jgi:hypothetical protein
MLYGLAARSVEVVSIEVGHCTRTLLRGMKA